MAGKSRVDPGPGAERYRQAFGKFTIGGRDDWPAQELLTQAINGHKGSDCQESSDHKMQLDSGPDSPQPNKKHGHVFHPSESMEQGLRKGGSFGYKYS